MHIIDVIPHTDGMVASRKICVPHFHVTIIAHVFLMSLKINEKYNFVTCKKKTSISDIHSVVTHISIHSLLGIYVLKNLHIDRFFLNSILISFNFK